MKVLDLQCGLKHSFEGWFGSEDDFQNQLARGLVECPMCSDANIHKLPSAPRLNLGGRSVPDVPGVSQAASSRLPVPVPHRADREETVGSLSHDGSVGVPLRDTSDLRKQSPGHPSESQQGQFLRTLREVVARTEDVGGRFAEEARRMHYGEVKARSIRGQASAREAVELLEEGIEVLPLPLVPALKETLQ